MAKIRIVHIITTLELGGAQKNALDIIENLDASKYEKFFISSQQGLLQKRLKSIKNVNYLFLQGLCRKISPLNDFITILKIASFIRKNRISIVHTHSSKAGILGRWAAALSGVKIIIHTIHGWGFNDYQSFGVRKFYLFLEKITARITTSLIAVSKADIEKGINCRIGSRQQYKLIGCGITSPQSKKASTPQFINDKDENIPKIAMISCLKPQKNPLDFLKMAKKIKRQGLKAVFYVIGDGFLRPDLEVFIQKNKLNDCVKLLGWRRDILELLPFFNIIVQTSLWEGLPLALLEAMAAGKPVVAYNVGGVKEIIKEAERGYLIKPKDVQALTERVIFLLANKDVAIAIGRRGKSFWQESEFHVEKMISKIETVYSSYGG